MTKADLIDEVSKLAELTRKDSEVIVETIFDSIVRSLRVGDKIEIRGFGSFRTRQRKPRVGRNPKTGERVEVPAKKIPFFKPSKELKDLVNTGGGQTPRRQPLRHHLRLQRPRRGGRLIRPAEQSSADQPLARFRIIVRGSLAVFHLQPSNGHRQPESSGPALPGLK